MTSQSLRPSPAPWFGLVAGFYDLFILLAIWLIVSNLIQFFLVKRKPTFAGCFAVCRLVITAPMDRNRTWASGWHKTREPGRTTHDRRRPPLQVVFVVGLFGTDLIVSRQCIGRIVTVVGLAAQLSAIIDRAPGGIVHARLVAVAKVKSQ